MPKRILLADDSITIQKVVELTFSDGDFEVTAVNNGAKAIAKLSEMRPDVILSDIIMPEKNGYEVCEYVKSHPEYRNIPVILLTGTFEPFDPDRADKAGCDAVVTKPFESQSLIHKVDELISSSRAAAPAESASPATHDPELETPAAPAGDPWAAPAADPFAAHDGDIFGAAPAASTPTLADMPFEEPTMPTAPAPASPWDDAPAAFGGETRAFPRMSFDELQAMANETPAPAPAPAPEPPPSAPEPSPWDDAPAAFGGETRAFPRMSFEEMQAMANPPAPEPEPAPFEPPAPPPIAPNAPAAADASPWDEAPQAFGGETRAFPRMSFEELQQIASASTPQPSAPEPEPIPMTTPEPSPWDSGPDVSEAAGDTMTPFDAPAAPSEPEWAQPAASEPEWAQPAASEPEWAQPAASEPEWAQPAEPEPAFQPEAFAAEPTAVNSQITDFTAPAATPSATPASAPSDLTEEQVDRIARRVVELMSEQLVRNIAWEVVPEVAEMVVKERIRQLEAEA